jgi:hypothetical protein
VPLPLDEGEPVRTFWQSHFAWKASGLTQREYCEQNGLSLKNLGNWRAQLKQEAWAARQARWARHQRLRHMVSHMASHRARFPAVAIPPVP